MLRRRLALALVLSVSPVWATAAAEPVDLFTTLPVLPDRSAARAAALPAPVAKSMAGDVALAAAAWLEGQQKVGPHASPGAFPWTADDAAVYSNTQGATALGLVRAHERTGEASMLATAADNGNCIVTKCISGMAYSDGDHRFATHDPLFLEALSAASGNALYASYVDTFFWDKLAGDSYGETNDLDAADFAQAVVTGRTSQNIPEIAAWDLSKLVIAANLAGETAARDAFLAGVLASLEVAGAPNDTYDVVGLAGGLWAAATVGVELDPTAGAWAADDSNLALASRLLVYQSSNGGFIVGTSQPVDDAETSAQSTAFAMQALAAVDADLFAAEINAGFAYLVSLQQPSGQFLSFAGASGTDNGSVESHGETLEAYSVLQLGPDRWVDANAGADTGSCSSQAAPCLTIQYAVDQAFEGDTIHIASGDYVEKVVVATDGLLLRGEGATTPTLAFASGGTNQSLLTVDGALDVTIENLALTVDVSYLGEGLLCTNGCSQLTVRDSSFTQLQSTATRSTYGRTNAISAGVIGTHPDPVEITVQGTTIAGDPGSPIPTQFRAGVALDNGFGLVGGAGVGDGNDIVSINHDVIVRNSEGGPVTIQGNTFRGFGVQYTTPKASTLGVNIAGNTFEPLVPPDSPASAGDFSAMRFISNDNGIVVTVSDNDFMGHERGVLIENFPGVTLTDNSFVPKAGSTSFEHLVISNKELFTDNPPPLPLPAALSVMAFGNQFSAGSVPGTGTAVLLLNDNAQGEPAGGYYGGLHFGGGFPEGRNSFDPDLGWYFELGNFSCADSNEAPCPLAPLYEAALDPGNTRPWVGTPVVEFAGNVNASNNLFGGVLPAEMDAGQRNALLARTQDSRADADLGTVDYGFLATQPEVFVDDDFAGAGYGDELTMVHSDGSVNGRTVYFGIDAFASIGDALMAVEEDGIVWIADGSFAEAVSVAKRVDIRGDGSVATTTIAGPLSVTASGVDALNPLVFSGFVVANPGGDGMALSGTVSNLRFEGVAFEGNSGNGINFVGSGNDSIAFVGPDCRIRNNGQHGVRHATTAVASGVSFDGCLFEGNRTGILLFGASASGAGQILDWSVANSSFVGNEDTDADAFGGGIWIKTGGAGSVIDGFSVTGSVFEDNGSLNNLNRVGVTIRARPGTTLANVSLCSNSFAETAAPGTQVYGVLVFDDTNNNGYQPVEVCDSSFDGLVAVSGNEQEDLRETQPVVILDNNTVTNGSEREFVNDPVLNVDTGELFATFGQAMVDADTAAGHTIRGGLGVYTEAVVVAHAGMTVEGLGADTEIAGTALGNVSGISVPTGLAGVTIRDLLVRDFTAMSGERACVLADRTPGIAIDGLVVENCQGGRGGIYVNGSGGIDGVTITNNDVSNVGPGGGIRGIVVWNGFKQNITITGNYVHDMAGCCGIELQDGTASGVTITGNTIERTGDNGIGVVGLTSGAGPNLIANNTITDAGRFGIEVKLPNGTGLDSGDGSIVVEGNSVGFSNSFFALYPGEQRDLAGIAVFRRGWVAGENNVDIPVGVVVRNNNVSGYTQDNPDSDSDGFGIVLEGLAMSATGNDVVGSDVGIQRQQGHLPYSASTNIDGNQSDLADDYFGRGNSPVTCAFVDANSFSSNGVDQRDVGGSVGVNARNDDTGEVFCGIQAAINDADTLDGHTVSVFPGEHPETALLDKAITLAGPFAGVPGHDASRDGSGEAVLNPPSGTPVRLGATGARVDGITITGSAGVAVLPTGSSRDDLEFVNNRVVDMPNGTGIRFEPGEGNPASGFVIADNLFANLRGSGIAGSAIQLYKGTRDAEVRGNVIDGVQNYTLQANGGNGLLIGLVVEGNLSIDSQALGSGTAYVITNTQGVSLSDNVVDGTGGGLFISDASSDLSATCNTITVSGNALSSAEFFGPVPNANVRIFHNALDGGTEIRNGLSEGWVVGSNWYGGAAPVLDDAAGGLLVADPLPANPVGDALCGNNSPVTLALFAGDGQAAVVAQPFAADLEARVTDALGGAVSGIDVDFATPGAGASATPGAATVATDYNGVAALAVTANTVAGSYQADASSASASGAAAFGLTNLAGPVAAIQSFAGDGQDVIAGLAVPVAPAVQAVDSFGNGVAGIPVGFEITQGGGSLSGATQSSGADGVATLGSWTTGRNAGTKQLEASVPGQPALGTVGFTANAAEQADVAVAKTSTQNVVAPGDLVDYLITVSNNGPSHAQAVDVLDLLPAQLDETSAGWLCVASGGASCNGSDDGSGDVALTASVPFGGSVSIVLSAEVRITVPDGFIDNTAVVELTSGDDPVPGNDTSTRSVSVVGAGPAPDGIFSDGFEGETVVAKSADSGPAPKTVELAPDWAGLDLHPRPVLQLRDASGKPAASVDAIGLELQRFLRLRHRAADGSEQAGAWQRWDRADALLDWQWQADRGLELQLVGDRVMIERQLPEAAPLSTARGRHGTRID